MPQSLTVSPSTGRGGDAAWGVNCHHGVPNTTEPLCLYLFGWIFTSRKPTLQHGGVCVQRGRQMCHWILRHSHLDHISTTWSPGLQCFGKSLLDGQRWERLFRVLHARMSVPGRDAAHSPWQRFPQSRTAQGCVCQFLLLLSVARSGKSTGT